MIHRHAGTLGTAIAALVLLAAVALPANAVVLTVPAAKKKARTFAASTCKRDRNCVRSGVVGCRRNRPHVAYCRIFLRRHTEVQGRYVCRRLVRLGIGHKTSRVRVTGVGRWNC